MELTEAAVDEDDVGVELVALAGFPVPAGDDFAHTLVVVVGEARDRGRRGRGTHMGARRDQGIRLDKGVG